MNPKPISETEAIRSDIEMTRRRMDDTMNALGERMKGRHLLDEVIGFFRGSDDDPNGSAARIREKFTESAGTAANAVVDTVKKNPLPILLITAGAAWLAYSATRGRRSEFEEEDLDESGRYDPDTHYDRPLAYPGTAGTAFGQGSEGMMEEGESKMGQMKESMHEKTEQVKQKLSELGDRTRDKMHSVKERASEFGSRVRGRASEVGGRVQEQTRVAYDRTRERVSRTADEHPIEVGLACLAAGVLVGLALPATEPVNRLAGPTVDRLRTRTRDAGREAIEKGKRVVAAATEAAKQEAQSQGLTTDRLHASGPGLAAGGEAAAEEAECGCDVATTENKNRTPAEPADPSAVRPAM